MAKPIQCVGEEMAQKIAGLLKASKDGLTVPDLATRLKTTRTIVFGHMEKFLKCGLVSKYDGTSPGFVGRPAKIYAWEGKPVQWITLHDAQVAQATRYWSKAEHREAARRAANRRVSKMGTSSKRRATPKKASPKAAKARPKAAKARKGKAPKKASPGLSRGEIHAALSS